MKIVDGNTACSNIAYLFSEVCSIYPITPSSVMAENIDYLTGTDKLNIFSSKPLVVQMESELGAAGALHGALLSGSLATSFTASQGLLLMLPNLYKIAGECLPGVLHVAARSISTHALSIFGDHQDIYSARTTGVCMIASTNVYDAQNLAAVTHLSALEGSLPFIHFFDGFRTSHEINTIKEIDEVKLKSLVSKNALEKFKNRALITQNKINYGTSQNEDVYFQITESRNELYNNMPDIVNNYMQKINEMMGTSYKPFNYYGSKNAKYIIVAMGSVCDTIKLVIDNELKNNNENYGLIEVHLYRPFSVKYLKEVLPSNNIKIAVLDKTKEHGSIGEPLYLDVVSALSDLKLDIVGGRYGLSSKNVTPQDIKSVYNMLESKMVNNFTVGINDDVTFLSLPKDDYNIKLNFEGIKIYGFGSDGMVSANKDILKLIYKSLNKYVQGYFEYDSKKSGGVTISHLRYSDNAINAPFYVLNPKLIVITKDEYFKKFDMLNDAQSNAYVLVNTIKNEKEFNDFLPNSVKKIIKDKNLNINIINAEKIAYENFIPGKISKIMEVNILNLLNIPNALDLIIESIKKSFATKGNDIVENNINAVKNSCDLIKHIDVSINENLDEKSSSDIYSIINSRKGNDLSVNDLKIFYNGQLPCGLSKYEKRNISSFTAYWNKEKCIECGKCNILCPHGVIRPYIIKNKDYGKALLEDSNYNYYLDISYKDCTGCGICIKNCPTKALELKENNNEEYANINELGIENNLNIFSQNIIKNTSLQKPLFAYSGACAGCGETPYIKLLTQIVKDSLVIANATGCSSIYGGSFPSSVYEIAWANSLFEDNAEFAYGIYLSYKQKRERIKNIITDAVNAFDEKTKDACLNLLLNFESPEFTKSFEENIDKYNLPKEIINLKEYIPYKNVWAIGGDGWAYDIGYNGIDHVLNSNENMNILVLDTEVYSNTGGQASKSTQIGATCEFADFGKRTYKKDLFKIAMCFPNVYIGSISLGANINHAIKTLKEANDHKGPSIVICYCPCIEHGIKGGMSNSINEEKLAVECGYTLLMRYKDDKLYLDSKAPDFDKYKEFLSNEVRYNALKIKDSLTAENLLNSQINYAKKRYEYFNKIKNVD